MPLVRQRTFCRICEAHCGLVVEVERATQQVRRILPDREHPVSQGYCCAKGLRLGEVHHDPDRLSHPLKRTAAGLERISWAQALSEIGGKLQQLRSSHGSRSIGMYRGNPSFFSYQHYLFATAFMDALGSVMHEAGHGMYEQGLPMDHVGMPRGEAVSLTVHESQSRLWENLVGRSRAFWVWCRPHLLKHFGHALGDASVDELHASVNEVQPDLIRVDADEATYNLHIMIRFELERALLNGEV